MNKVTEQEWTRASEKAKQAQQDRTNTPEAKKIIKEKLNQFHLREKGEYLEKIEGLDLFTNLIRIAEMFCKQQPVYYDKAKNFWLWRHKKKCWELIDETELLNALDERQQGLNTVDPKTKSMVLESLKRVGRKNKPANAKKTWVQFKDKIIDVKTGEEFDANPEWFVTNPIPWKIGILENTPNIDKLFTEWVGEKWVQTLYEIIAYCCLADYPIHRMFCLIGRGRNGKGSYMTIIQNFLGLTNCASTDLDLLLASRFEVTKLYKKLACFMGETNFTTLDKTALIKRLTGQDLIGFEMKQKTPFDDYNYATLIIATNCLPQTTDNTDGFFSRSLIVDFPNQFSEKKDILDTIPETEYENLARKCLEILKVLVVKREFTNEGTIEERKKRYEERSNPLQKFLETFTVEDPEGYIPKFEFMELLNGWLKKNGYRTLNNTEIGKSMNEKYETRKKRLNLPDKPEPVDWNCYIGLRYKQKVNDFGNGFQCFNSFNTFSLNSLIRKSSGNSMETMETMETTKENSSEIHHKCSICGQNHSHFFDKTGKPVCNECVSTRLANGERSENFTRI